MTSSLGKWAGYLLRQVQFLAHEARGSRCERQIGNEVVSQCL